MGVYKGMLLEERLARVELEQRIEAAGGVVPSPAPSALGAEGGGGGAGGGGSGGPTGASSRLIGGIRRLQRKDSWGRKTAGASPAPSPRLGTDGQPAAKRGASFLKGVAGNLGALASDLADAALGSDAGSAGSQGGSGGRGARMSGGALTPGSDERGGPLASPPSTSMLSASSLPGPPPRSPLPPPPGPPPPDDEGEGGADAR